jgi:environmental stress-induced protein Ves
MAAVATDGPFSVFSGIDRTLSILEGEGMTLFIEGREPVLLTRDSDPLPFAADAPTSATLVDGAITDLNVMTRRGSFTHSVRCVSVNGTVKLAPRGGVTLILCHRGRAEAAGLSLSAGDCLLLEAVWTDITVSGTAELFQIDIRRL